MADLAVVIISWNTRALTIDALSTLHEDLAQHGPPSTDIWVLDNASIDDSAAAIRHHFPAVHLLESKKNLGFGAGNNTVIRELGFGKSVPVATLPKAVYLLNSDTRTHPGATSTLYHTLLSLPDAGVVGARLTYEDGSFQHSAFAFPGLIQLWFDLLPAPLRFYDTPINGRYPRLYYENFEPFPVGHTLGATMMLRREVIQQTGMFDEQFFMYAEEVDWAWRIHKAGWKVYCVPTAHVTHLAGQSTQQVKPESILNLWQSRLRLFHKHYSLPRRLLARQLLHAGMRYKIRQTHQAYARRQISAKERDMLISAYRQVIRL
jgi:N-acetylglucosaminyl-diphospho-decaprenol L-rhamnosyltransferase